MTNLHQTIMTPHQTKEDEKRPVIEYGQCWHCGKWANQQIGVDMCQKCLKEAMAEIEHEEMMWGD